MYSKERGNTFEPRPIPLRHQPMYHQPNRPRMQVPPNYNGHAIVDGEERPLGQTEEERFTESELSPSDAPTPRFDDLPRVSELPHGSDRPHSGQPPYGSMSWGLTPGETPGEIPGQIPGETPGDRPSERSNERSNEPNIEERTDATRDRPEPTRAEEHAAGRLVPCYEAVAVPPAEGKMPTDATEKRRGLFDLGRFPFGRGLGVEELLILGLILLLLRESGDSEDRGDLDETVILLGLLLILG